MSPRLIMILINIACFVPAIVLHEVMHGWAAYKLGDPTAKRAGRLTLNPIKHMDPFGSVILPGMLILFGGPVFGYAKPVPYDPRYFKDPKKGDAIVGLAGPLANLALACLAALVAWICYPLYPAALYSNNLAFAIFYLYFLPSFMMINLYLMFFNLLPIPPLDGSSLIALILPKKYMPQYYQVQHYAFPILLVLLFVVPSFLHVDPISAYLNFTAGGLGNLLFPIPVM